MGGGARALDRQAVQPPFHDAVRLGKETVSPKVNAIALVVMSSGDPAHISRPLKNQWNGAASLEEFVSGGEPGRPGADDDCAFVVHVSPDPQRPGPRFDRAGLYRFQFGTTRSGDSTIRGPLTNYGPDNLLV